MLLNAACHGLVCELSCCTHESLFRPNSFKQNNLNASCVDWCHAGRLDQTLMQAVWPGDMQDDSTNPNASCMAW